ncbi:MAG TPA: class I SAM-dependent methyltransferase, partial [Terriglobia bacterium]|nr:class I SAM-dependent methyltransferase [Terriglobia bacterium]
KNLTREGSSCLFCKSNVRFRTLMVALSQSLYGTTLPLSQFQKNKGIRGLGMSDWDGYATQLARKFDYINTYYDVEPRFDITQMPKEWISRFDFLISSDVFEHIVSPISAAFENAFKLLKPGGTLVLTVPFLPYGTTCEHFGELNEFEVVDDGKKKRLKNISKDGTMQWFDDLIFHGGIGATLEMREFTLPSLLLELRGAGFDEIKSFQKAVPSFGIPDAGPRSFPITARRPLAARGNSPAF